MPNDYVIPEKVVALCSWGSLEGYLLNAPGVADGRTANVASASPANVISTLLVKVTLIGLDVSCSAIDFIPSCLSPQCLVQDWAHGKCWVQICRMRSPRQVGGVGGNLYPNALTFGVSTMKHKIWVKSRLGSEWETRKRRDNRGHS